MTQHNILFQVLLDWSKHYWQLLLKQDNRPQSRQSTPDPRRDIKTKKRLSTPTGGLFSPFISSSSLSSRAVSSPSCDAVFDQAMKEEALMSLASASLFQHYPHRALELYSEVNTAQACWNSCQVCGTKQCSVVHLSSCICSSDLHYAWRNAAGRKQRSTKTVHVRESCHLHQVSC